MKRFLLALPVALLLTLFGLSSAQAQTPASTSSPTDLSHLLIALRNKATTLESNSTMRVNFESFTSSRKLTPGTIRYSDYVMVHLLFEAARDARFALSARRKNSPAKSFVLRTYKVYKNKGF